MLYVSFNGFSYADPGGHSGPFPLKIVEIHREIIKIGDNV
jgi:hypothetical protein